ncbi:MAG: hypothetical protein AB2L18_12610 [Anaerolineaceae bacterium]
MINTEDKTCQSVNEWLTLQEASHITGKSINALTLLISRGKIDRSKKIAGRGKGKWLIHKDSIGLISPDDRLKDQDRTEPGQTERLTDRSDPVIPLNYFDSKMKEWTEERDRLQAGLLMYRYKFEELDRQIRLLPAPVESIPSKITELEQKTAEKDQALQRSQETIKALEEALQSEKQRSWWDRLWKR